MIRAIAWDIDGTLVDSEGLHHEALIAVSARHGVAIERHDTRFVGVAMDHVWESLQPVYPQDISQARWLEEIVAAYLETGHRLAPFPGALAALARLRAAGIRQCCVSNSLRAVVNANLTAIGVADDMEFAVSRDDVRRGKPDPEPYREAVRRLGLNAADVLAVEDSDTGAAAAQAAGCRVWRIAPGISAFEQLADHVLKGVRIAQQAGRMPVSG